MAAGVLAWARDHGGGERGNGVGANNLIEPIDARGVFSPLFPLLCLLLFIQIELVRLCQRPTSLSNSTFPLLVPIGDVPFLTGSLLPP